MSWRNNPRVESLVEKATVQTLLKVLFQKIYGEKEVQEMENSLKKALNSFPRKEKLYEVLYDRNNEKEALPLLNDCLERMCIIKLKQALEHTSSTLLTLARLLRKIGDRRIAAEMIWCAASVEIQDFIATKKIAVELISHASKKRFVKALSPELTPLFRAAEMCHSSFYTNYLSNEDLTWAMEEVEQFIEKLRSFELTDEKRKELESTKGYNDP